MASLLVPHVSVECESPGGSQTTMVDDTPTEARMYPSGWGELK